MRVYWVRHGETTENVKATYYGALEAELTPKGIKELEKYHKRWPENMKVYSSPKKRALQTASIIGYEHPIIDERLIERNMGVWEGLSFSEITKRYPYEAALWQKDWVGFKIPEGESAKMQYERVKEFMKTLEASGEDALVISHGGTMQMALAYMLFENIEAFWKFKTSPGALIVSQCLDGYWYVEEIVQ